MTGVEFKEQEHISLRQSHAADVLIKGRLVPLRTKVEVQCSNETTSVYIVEIPNRSANGLLNVLRDVVPAEVTNSLQHLRRFAKPEFLPRHLCFAGSGGGDVDTSETLDGAPRSYREAKSTTSHLLICPTSTVSLSALGRLFQDHVDLFQPLVPDVREISVPVFAPTSAAQATEWSETYWPTIYKNTNPYGPHPALVRRAELEVIADGDADRFAAMARRVAKESGCTGVGVDVGAVIVERLESTKRPRIVAVAGDARHSGLIQNAQEPQNKAPHQECAGNVMGHAALRAIAIVAQKRRILAQLSDSAVPHEENGILDSTLLQSEPESFTSRPLSDTENQYLTAVDNLLPSGYLCLDLEIYLTHEPCVMCAMAILHSRFNRVVFEKQMPKTGALSAEGDSLGHGLFWRDQLNWKFLVWQWKPFSEDNTEDDFSELDLHA